MNVDDKLKALLTGDLEQENPEYDRVRQGMRRTRTSLGQQQTLALVLVKIWVAVSKVLAPFFAGMAKRQAAEKLNRNKAINSSTESELTPSEK